MQFVFDIVLLGVMGFVLYVMYSVVTELRILSAKEHEEKESYSDVQEHLSAYEMERLEREDEFDKRIEMLKEQLANQQHEIKRSGLNAEELHPHVKNLLHNIIPVRDTEPPDVEYME